MRRKITKPRRSMPHLKVIPIGGLNEIGKNMTLLECDGQILIVDCGLSFPEDEMYGIDIVIPDFTYLIENSEKIVGMVITHGHEDHIGAIPYLLKKLKLPIYGTRLTLGLVENKLKEHRITGDLRTIEAGDKIKLGCFDIETIRTTHSIADAICLAIDTPAGMVFHSGDFKIDYTPVDGEPIDFCRLAELGKRGVTLMLCDSTNALRPGFTASEKVVGETIENIFRTAKTRIIIATFSSNVHRVQKIIENAVKVGRKVAISGRSMENVVALAIELGYLNIPEGTLVDLKMIRNIPDDKLVIITTGSQGEPMSALSRIAAGEHRSVKLKKGDMVVLSSTPVPGNEKTVSNVVNKLFEKGAEVIYSDIADIHVSGHACQEELKLLHSLIKPKFFMPVHGEYRHLIRHAQLAEGLGMKKENIFILENGDILDVTKRSAHMLKEKAEADAILVDGLGVGDVGNIVLRDRKMLSESGLIIVVAAIERESQTVVSGPDIISRGFVYVRENEPLMDEARKVAEKALKKCQNKKIKDWNNMKSQVRDSLGSYIYDRTKRTPIILPIFLEV
jgi:ribonuclease J